MTRDELAQVQLRHYASPMSTWRIVPIPGKHAFVEIHDDHGVVIESITPDDAEELLAAHNDRAAVIAENRRLRELVEKQRGYRKSAEFRASHLRQSLNTRTERFRTQSTEWTEERARLQSQLADARDADASVAKYRKPLADILNIPWDTTVIGGVNCVRSPWIPLRTIVAAKRLVADIAPIPTRSTKKGGHRDLYAA